MTLKEFFDICPKAALAFSGGVDSAYLLYAAVQSGADVKPYFIKTPFQPESELRDARLLAEELGTELTVLEHDVLADEQVASNPPDRCYHCKKAIFGRLKERAAADGYRVILDGTNASDLRDDRPGMKALEEMEIRSPLRECGLTKDQIRSFSREAGLFTWNKPSYACLATRFPAGTDLTEEKMAAAEQAENALKELGFSDFRVRVWHGAARLQFPEKQWLAAAGRRQEIRDVLKPFFQTVFLDLEVR